MRGERNWREILTDAKKRGLSNGELARDLRVTPPCVSQASRRYRISLDANRQTGTPFKNDYKPKFICPAEWGLTKQGRQVVGVLMDAEGVCSMDYLQGLCVNKGSTKKAVVKAIHCVRQALMPFKVAIRTAHGRGVYIDRATKNALRAGRTSLDAFPLERAA